MERTKIPNYPPYLPNRYDLLDQCYQLRSEEVSEISFAEWWAVVFKKAKIKTLQSALNLQKYNLNFITKCDDGWQTDLYGTMFGAMGMYKSDDFYMPWFNREVLKGEDTLQKRFDYINQLINKYFIK